MLYLRLFTIFLIINLCSYAQCVNEKMFNDHIINETEYIDENAEEVFKLLQKAYYVKSNHEFNHLVFQALESSEEAEDVSAGVYLKMKEIKDSSLKCNEFIQSQDVDELNTYLYNSMTYLNQAHNQLLMITNGDKLWEKKQGVVEVIKKIKLALNQNLNISNDATVAMLEYR